MTDGRPMGGGRYPAPLSLARFHREVALVPDLVVRVFPFDEILPRVLRHPPGPGYETQRARPFDPEDFCLPFLDLEELTRLNRFKVLKKQVEWVCGRFAAKTLVREVLMPGKKRVGIRIGYRPEGAPFLEAMEDHCLSLSHSRGMTAVALGLAPGRMLGIDIEALGPMPDSGFMRTAFTAREIRAMAPGAEEVFRCWTLKEAYLKFIKKGFNESLHQVEVVGQTIRHRGKEQALDCRSWHLDSGHALSLVTPGAPMLTGGTAA